MADMFSNAPRAPLPELLRPKTLDEVVGQRHLLAPGKPLRMAFNAGKLHSFILWGPPGVGKTTLARLTASMMDCEFIALSAVMAGVKDIREAAVRAQDVLDLRNRSTVLFMDEIHRLNKGQQDALLPFVESGLFVLVGATTENPAFSIVSALLSRAQVYVLKALDEQDLLALFLRVETHLEGIAFDQDARELLARAADGDARRFLHLVEQLKTAALSAGHPVVTLDIARESAGPVLRRFDRSGDDSYEQISAFQKSIRGSKPDAALYWLARMLDAGADPTYIARRLVVIASEDVGNADPRALGLAVAAAEAYARLGSPEGDRALAQAAVYLSVAPKSNAVYTAWNEAQAYVKANRSSPVPLHLRNAPTQLMKDLGFKKGYRYAHDEPHAYAAGECYFPEDVPEPTWYRPVERGMEVKVRDKMAFLKELDEAAAPRRRVDPA